MSNNLYTLLEIPKKIETTDPFIVGTWAFFDNSMGSIRSQTRPKYILKKTHYTMDVMDALYNIACSHAHGDGKDAIYAKMMAAVLVSISDEHESIKTKYPIEYNLAKKIVSGGEK